MIVSISVTQDDIDNGLCGGDSCPVARAARRALPSLPDLWVGSDGIYDHNPVIGEEPGIAFPGAAVEWIGRYDCGLSMQPFAFDLDIPENLPEATP